MGKIRFEINMGSDTSPRWEVARLNKGTKIKMTVVNPIFERESKGSFSQMFSLDVEMNRHIFGNTDQLHGRKVHDIIRGRKYRLSVLGVPFSWGVIHLSDEVDVKDEVDIEIVGNDKEWSDIIKDMNCQDVKPMTEVKLGWGVKWIWASTRSNRPYDPNRHMRIEIPPYYFCNSDIILHQNSHANGNWDTRWKNPCVNVSQPYPASPFCNLRFCYQASEKDGDTWKQVREYGVIEPNVWGNPTSNVNPDSGYSSGSRDFSTDSYFDNEFYDDEGNYRYFKSYTAHLQHEENFPHPPQFYVKYWLKSLFHQLGIAYDESTMNGIADFNRMFFYNTNFGYDLKDSEYRSVAFFKRSAVNNGRKWFLRTTLIDIFKQFNETEWWISRLGYMPYLCSVYGDDVEKNKVWGVKRYGDDGYGNTDGMKVGLNAEGYINMEGGTMIANSKNFPNKEVSECITQLENLLGMRMLYDSRRGKAEFVFLKDILSQETCRELRGVVTDMYPTFYDVRGFELTYSGASDENRKAQQEKGEKFGDDFSLAYDYYDYENVTRKSYSDIISSISAFDVRVCYDDATGDAYRYKNDKEEEQKADGNVSYYYPSTFEVAQFVRATEGDLSDEDFVEKIEIGIEPLTFNIVSNNTVFGRASVSGPKYAKFFDATEMSKSENDSSHNGYKTDINVVLPIECQPAWGNDPMWEGYICGVPVALSFYAYRHWDASSSNLPLIGSDDTFAVGIMRGGGSEAGISIVQENYDGEGHDLWVETVGTYASHFDIMDNYGHMFDYNGKDNGIGAKKSDLLSLRLRAEKENPQYDPSKPETDICANGFPNTRFFPITNEYAKKRGIFDRLYTEYAHFALNKNVMNFTLQGLTIADILNIDLKKKYIKNDVRGWIKQYEYEIDDDEGLGEVKLEMYYL